MITKNQRPFGYWRNWDNFKRHMGKAIETNNGNFPKGKELRKLGFAYLETPISRHHGGIFSVREKMGYENGRNKKGFWKKWENVEIELEEVIKKLGHFPTQRELIRKGMGGLIKGVSKYHGGFRNVREKLGFKFPDKPKNYWKKWKNVESPLRKIIDELGYFPTANELGNFEGRSIVNSIHLYHGGMNVLREKLGHNVKKKNNGYWKDWNNVKIEIEDVMKKLGHFPTNKELIKIKRSSLSQSIQNYHGGFHKVRSIMKVQESVEKPKGYWKNWKNVGPDLIKIIDKLGYFPKFRELIDLGKSDLSHAIIRHHGGLNSVKIRMGYDNSNQLESILEDYVGA